MHNNVAVIVCCEFVGSILLQAFADFQSDRLAQARFQRLIGEWCDLDGFFPGAQTVARAEAISIATRGEQGHKNERAESHVSFGRNVS